MIIRVISIFLTMLFTTYAQAANTMDKSASLFRSVSKDYAEYELIDSAMIFQEKDTDAFSKGYRPTSSSKIAGKLVKKVYDFPRKYSAAGVFQNYRTNYLSKGFEILFECSGQSCGDIVGWSLYLSDRIGGQTSSQLYAAFKGRNSSTGMLEYIVIHTSDLDVQPRLIHHTLTGSRAFYTFRDYSPSMLESDPKLLLMHEFFFDSDNATEFKKDDLDKLVEALKATPKSQELVLVGYTDSEGSRRANLDLSKRRAESVFDFLAKKRGIDQNLFTLFGKGEYPNLTKASDQSTSRKVSVYKFVAN